MPSKKHKLVSGPEELKLAPFMRLLKAVHSMGEPESFTPEDLEKQRRSQDALGNMAASMSGLVWEPFTLAGMDAAWMRLSREHRRRRVILYCHGGYTSGGLDIDVHGQVLDNDQQPIPGLFAAGRSARSIAEGVHHPSTGMSCAQGMLMGRVIGRYLSGKE